MTHAGAYIPDMFKPLPLDEFAVTGPVPAKAALIAAPVLMHPQLAKDHFPSDPILPKFDRIFEALLSSINRNCTQSLVILDRLVSPSWVASACIGGADVETASKLVAGHCLERNDPFFTLEDWIVDEGIHRSKHIIGFIAGAIYRQEEDPEALILPNPQSWNSSSACRSVESALCMGSTLLRNRVLAPCAADEALMNGFEGLCRMYLELHGQGSRVDADFLGRNQVLITVHRGTVRTEFIVDLSTLPERRVEQLLQRLSAMQMAFRLAGSEAEDEERIVH